MFTVISVFASFLFSSYGQTNVGWLPNRAFVNRCWSVDNVERGQH